MMKKRVLKAFKAYTDHYDISNVNIRLKIDHTYRVAAIAEQIAKSVGLGEYNVGFCWLLGMLHDIGRFEQYTRFGTFKDAESLDHAELGANILFNDGLITSFIDPEEWNDPDGIDYDGWDEMRPMAEVAIRMHNKLTLPETLDEGERFYAELLRDSDKCDIMRVLTEPPYDERNARIVEGSKDGGMLAASEDIMNCVYQHRCVPKSYARTDFENLISQCCMGFELVFPKSREIVKRQGYLAELMNLNVKDKMMAQQLAILRNEMEKAWKE
ncbi:MAG: HDIG domain-containing protein [Lachnospiraceae bacterium]|nr:HDIG domain-containing protein [Lachnospiraceae bacterium]